MSVKLNKLGEARWTCHDSRVAPLRPGGPMSISGTPRTDVPREAPARATASCSRQAAPAGAARSLAFSSPVRWENGLADRTCVPGQRISVSHPVKFTLGGSVQESRQLSICEDQGGTFRVPRVLHGGVFADRGKFDAFLEAVARRGLDPTCTRQFDGDDAVGGRAQVSPVSCCRSAAPLCPRRPRRQPSLHFLSVAKISGTGESEEDSSPAVRPFAVLRKGASCDMETMNMKFG